MSSAKNVRQWFGVLAAAAMLAVLGGCAAQKPVEMAVQGPRNVIILIGDGMGPEHIKAASLAKYGQEGKLFMETSPHQGVVRTSCAKRGTVTDSAAAAMAMATGVKVNNGVLSLADGKPLPTSMEVAIAQGKSAGLVTTAPLTDATPAAFLAHVETRKEGETIARQMLAAHPDVLMGGNGSITPAAAKQAGYTVVQTPGELAKLPAGADHVAGLFHEDRIPYVADAATQPALRDARPGLSQMALSTLGILDRNPKGFVVMIEGGNIDVSAHANALPRMVAETLEFDDMVRDVVKWANGRQDTLVVVLADHETGGLKAKGYPNVTWSSKGHTGVDIRIFAWGVSSSAVHGRLDNTDIYRLTMGKPPQYCPASQPAPVVKTASSRPAVAAAH